MENTGKELPVNYTAWLESPDEGKALDSLYSALQKTADMFRQNDDFGLKVEIAGVRDEQGKYGVRVSSDKHAPIAFFRLFAEGEKEDVFIRRHSFSEKNPKINGLWTRELCELLEESAIHYRWGKKKFGNKDGRLFFFKKRSDFCKASLLIDSGAVDRRLDAETGKKFIFDIPLGPISRENLARFAATLNLFCERLKGRSQNIKFGPVVWNAHKQLYEEKAPTEQDNVAIRVFSKDPDLLETLKNSFLGHLPFLEKPRSSDPFEIPYGAMPLAEAEKEIEGKHRFVHYPENLPEHSFSGFFRRVHGFLQANRGFGADISITSVEHEGKRGVFFATDSRDSLYSMERALFGDYRQSGLDYTLVLASGTDEKTTKLFCQAAEEILRQENIPSRMSVEQEKRPRIKCEFYLPSHRSFFVNAVGGRVLPPMVKKMRRNKFSPEEAYRGLTPRKRRKIKLARKILAPVLSPAR